MRVILKPGGVVVLIAALSVLPILAICSRSQGKTTLIPGLAAAAVPSASSSILAPDFFPSRFLISPGAGSVSDFEANALPGQTTKGLRATVNEKTVHPWDVEVGIPSKLAVRAGQRLDCSIWARSRTQSTITVGIEQSVEPWQGLERQEFVLSPDWKEYHFSTVAKNNWPAAGVSCRVWFAAKPGEIEVTNPSVTAK